MRYGSFRLAFVVAICLSTQLNAEESIPWKNFSSDADGYSVDFPGDVLTYKSKDDGVVRNFADIPGSRTNLMAAAEKLPNAPTNEDAKNILTDLLNKKETDGVKIKERKFISVSGYTAVRFDAELGMAAPLRGTLNGCWLIANNSLYQFTAATPAGQPSRVREFEHFISTIKIISRQQATGINR